MRARILVLWLVFLLSGFTAFGQGGSVAVDKALDEYESLLKEALALKRSSAAGEKVLSYELYSLATRLSAIRKSLGSGSEMTDAQKERLAALIKWYETAEKGYEAGVVWVSPVVDTLNTAVVSSDFSPKNEFPVEKIAELLIDPAFNPFRVHPFLSFTVSGFDAVIPGVRVGLARKAYGGYLAAHLTPGKKAADYTCLSDGSIPSGGAIYTSGAKSLYHFGLSAGILFLPLRFDGLDAGRAGLYAGAGYGERNLYWQDIETKWAQVADRSWSGLSLEGGLTVHWRWLCLCAGIRTTGFNHADFEVGAGIRF